jgi:hypothetical protein
MKGKGRVLTMIGHAATDLHGSPKATFTARIANITHEDFPFVIYFIKWIKIKSILD